MHSSEKATEIHCTLSLFQTFYFYYYYFLFILHSTLKKKKKKNFIVMVLFFFPLRLPKNGEKYIEIMKNSKMGTASLPTCPPRIIVTKFLTSNSSLNYKLINYRYALFWNWHFIFSKIIHPITTSQLSFHLSLLWLKSLLPKCKIRWEKSISCLPSSSLLFNIN